MTKSLKHTSNYKRLLVKVKCIKSFYYHKLNEDLKIIIYVLIKY